MALVSIHSLLVIALLHLCRAELAGPWFSANAINDGEYSPKPISEIFSTPPNFSSSNPIIVLPSSTPSPTSDGSSSYSTIPPSEPWSFSTSAVSDGSTGFHSVPTASSYGPQFPSFPVQANEIFTVQSTQPPTISSQAVPIQTNDPLSVLHQLPQQAINSQGPNPNYILIYQQAPQSIQNLPTPSSQPSPAITFSTPRPSSISTASPEISSVKTTFTTVSPAFSTYQSTLPSLSTLRPEISTPGTTVSTRSSSISSTIRTKSTSVKLLKTKIASSTTAIPKTVNCTRNGSISNPLSKIPSLRIKIVAPSGSVSNVHINSPTTTKRPTTKRPRTTTTKRPKTTTKRGKKNVNKYDTCVNKCDSARKSPICSVPLNMNPINPDKLKGFASICHMACHNSFKKDRYEMLINGRCGKLRTRIRPANSDTKLSQLDLNKSQYFVEIN